MGANGWAQLAPALSSSADATEELARIDALQLEIASWQGHTGARGWLAVAFRDYHAAEGARTLDECLGLASSRGEPSYGTRMKRLRKDAAILDAWKSMRGSCRSDWACDIATTAQIRAFEESFLDRWTEAGGPPAGASDLRRALFAAFATGLPLPKTVKGVYELRRRVTRV